MPPRKRKASGKNTKAVVAAAGVGEAEPKRPHLQREMPMASASVPHCFDAPSADPDAAAVHSPSAVSACVSESVVSRRDVAVRDASPHDPPPPPPLPPPVAKQQCEQQEVEAEAEDEFQYGTSDEEGDTDAVDLTWALDEHAATKEVEQRHTDAAPSMDKLPSSVHRSTARSAAALFLARQMVEVQRVGATEGFTCDFVNDNAYHWSCSLTGFPADCPLKAGLDKLSKPSVDLEMEFPQDFPFRPPRVRIVRPLLTGNYIFSGALCMELLMDGWRSSYTMEAILVQIMAALVEGGARVTQEGTFSATSAESARRRILEHHARQGWGSLPKS